MQTRSEKTKRLVGLALFTAIVVVLQLLGSFIHLGTFSVSLVLVPIVVGAALYGVGGGFCSIMIIRERRKAKEGLN